MTFRPKPPGLKYSAPGAGSPSGSGWTSPARDNVADPDSPQEWGQSGYGLGQMSPSRGEPIGQPSQGPAGYSMAGRDDSDVIVGDGDIIGERADSRIGRAGEWGAGRADPDHVALSVSNPDGLDVDTQVRLSGLLDEHMVSFHEFINGDVSPQIVSDLLVSAERLVVSTGRFQSLEHFFGHEPLDGSVSLPTSYALPPYENCAGIAKLLGWKEDAFTDLVRMARVANQEQVVWTNPHAIRLYRMLMLLHEKGIEVNDEKGRSMPARQYLERAFERQAAERISMEDMIRLYGKAVGADLAFFDALEVALNATWCDETILVSKKTLEGGWISEPGWYDDEQDHVIVSSRDLADTASKLMHGEHRQVFGAALVYAMLAEEHLQQVGPSEGRYDFYDRELYRGEAINDVINHPTFYYDEVEPLTNRPRGSMNNRQALERLRFLFMGTDFEEEAAEITDAEAFIEMNRPLFGDMDLDTSWVIDGAHYARATLYSLIAVARFDQAGEELMEDDPEYARVCFNFARRMLGVYEERRMVMEYISGKTATEVRHIIIRVFDLAILRDLRKRIKGNLKRVTPRKTPPPRRRKK